MVNTAVEDAELASASGAEAQLFQVLSNSEESYGPDRFPLARSIESELHYDRIEEGISERKCKRVDLVRNFLRLE
jgi:hypothetical protein